MPTLQRLLIPRPAEDKFGALPPLLLLAPVLQIGLYMRVEWGFCLWDPA